MKVTELPKLKKFDPISFTVHIETEEELCDLVRRLYVESVFVNEETKSMPLDFRAGEGVNRELKSYLYKKATKL